MYATPAPGTVRDKFGPCFANPTYPLTAWCASCGAHICAVDGTADWAHFSRYTTSRTLCSC